MCGKTKSRESNQKRLRFFEIYFFCLRNQYQLVIGWSTKLAPTTGTNSLQPSSFGLMQEDHQQEPYYLRTKLLEAVDNECNVRDVPLILEVLGKLESLPVTKEVLESTRLGKTVNELRRNVKDAVLARRLKDLVRKWRDAVLSNEPPQKHPAINGTATISSAEGAQVVPGSSGNRNLLTTAGYTSASSSPTLVTPKVSPAAAGPHHSNSLSPRIGPLMTNYSTCSNSNNTSVHSLPANRNGSSSLASRSPNNHRNPHQISGSSISALVSPSASSASPHTFSRNLVSPHKSKSPGGPILQAFSNTNISNLSPLPSSHFQSATSSYAPNAETVSRTNVANKRYREPDDISYSTSVEPPVKRSRSTVNGTLDDPMLALDDISRDSYASRGSDHSDGFTSKEHHFSSSTLSPATPGQPSTLSPQMPVSGTDSNPPSPLALYETETGLTSQTDPQPKRRGRKKKNEFYIDREQLLREKIAQAEAEKAAKVVREREAKEREEKEAAAIASLQDVAKRRVVAVGETPSAEDNYGNNEFVEKYLKSQTELRVKMERDAMDILAGGDSHGAADSVSASNGRAETGSESFLKPKEKKKRKQKSEADGTTDDISSSHFPSESEILAKLPPIDPEILKEFSNYEYDVNPSPPPPPISEGAALDSLDNKETEGTHGSSIQSLSTVAPEKPPMIIDWGDSDDDMEDVKPAESASQVQTLSDTPVTPTTTNNTSTTAPTPISTVEIDSHSQDDGGTKDGLSTDAFPFHREHVDEEEVESYFKDKVPNVNGNYDKDGHFCEWHETLTVESYKQEPLHILPYTIIDF